jgi:hypothetical protein
MDGGKMKTLFVLFVFVAPMLSLADYIPGRTRPTAEAEMEAITGDGKFENIRSVQLTELSTDGKGVTHYELVLDGRSYSFTVSKASNGSCGDLYEAGEEAGIKLILRDMSFAECQFRAKHKWEAQVVDTEGGRASHLFIGGDPEHLLVSQGD